MLLRFFMHLRLYRIPVSLRELLDFLAALKTGLVFADMERFYFLSRICLVKDEKYFDRFDLAFTSYFRGLDNWPGVFDTPVNYQLLKSSLSTIFPKLSEVELRLLMNQYQQTISALVAQSRLKIEGGDTGSGANPERETQYEKKKDRSEESRQAENEFDRDRQDSDDSENQGEHGESGEEGDQGEGDSGDGGGGGEEGEEGEKGKGEDGEAGEGHDGNKGEGENGEKGQGSGDRPGAGVRTDLESVAQRSAIKVWELREYEDYDPDVELGTRNIKMALRRLRKFARTAADLELDLADTIDCTARNGGILDIKEIPERHNAVKVLLFLDVGGSMEDHVELCAQLFSAAKSEFKHLAYFYFHNFIYEAVWADNQRRAHDRIALVDLLRKYGRDYKVIFVGDSAMGRPEIAERGGSVEHYNAVAGEIWMNQVLDQFRKVIWLNPVAMNLWKDSYSTEMIRRMLNDRMYHLSIDGIESAMKYLVR